MLITMSHPRFFFPTQITPSSRLQLPKELAHHATRVLRLKDLSPIILFDGSGAEYPACLNIDGKHCYADVAQAEHPDRELKGHITLVQGLAASDKMDWIIEKAVELGIKRVVPVRAQRSVLQLSAERQAKRMTHWQGIVQAASTQCGRNYLMQLDAPCTLSEYLATQATGLVLLCHPGSAHALQDILTPQHKEVVLLVGPEGGWNDQEYELALRAGAQAIRFGPRVLRTETAGLALSAAITALQAWN